MAHRPANALEATGSTDVNGSVNLNTNAIGAPAETPLQANRLSSKSRHDPRRRVLVAGWAIVLGSYAVLGFAFNWPQQYRNTNTLFVYIAVAAYMIRVFLFHIGLGLVGLVFAALIGRAWRLAVAATPVALMSVGPALWQVLPGGADPIQGERLRIMSMNLLGANRSADDIVSEITESDPDLLLLQEYTPFWHDEMQSTLTARYPHVAAAPRPGWFGAAVYSKRPFSAPADISITLGDSSQAQARVEIEIGGETVAVYNVHIVPPLRSNFREMRLEFADLLDRVRAERMPLIVTGDFNFTEVSPNAAELYRLGFKDAFSLAGRSRGATWPDRPLLRYLPGFRIDHIYLSDELTCAAARVGRGAGSDHRPVLAEIGLRGHDGR